MSDGSAISWGSRSFSDNPDLLVNESKILGSRIKFFILKIDHELSDGCCVSLNISVRIWVKGSHSVRKWWKVSSSCSQNLQTFEISGSILFWCLPKKLWPVIARTIIVRKKKRIAPLHCVFSRNRL